MKLIKKTVTPLLIWILTILPMLEAMPQEQLSQEPEAGKVIILSDEVGEIIDREERNLYKLFPDSENFLSAVILQLPDSSLVVQITEMKEGVRQQRIMQINQEILEKLRENIENRIKIVNAMMENSIKIVNAKKQAKILAKEKWTKERWREETKSDRGTSYRTAGVLLGCTLGAIAGMLIGKNVQEEKVRKVETYHPEQGNPGEWGYTAPWTETEYFYTYKNKKAPHWGAVIGGISGGVTGYFLGRKADKEYYILIPKDIRVQWISTSGIGTTAFGLCIAGPVIGIIAGWTLYTPSYSRDEKKRSGGNEFLGGYLAGSIIGGILHNAYRKRLKHKQLWEKSIREGKSGTSYEVKFIPLDQTTFRIYPRMSPSGEIYYEYRIDLLRIHF